MDGTPTPTRRGRRTPLVGASGVATPFKTGSFDLVFCDHGAMSFCDPYTTSYDYADVDWARRWPTEEIWKVRKLAGAPGG